MKRREVLGLLGGTLVLTGLGGSLFLFFGSEDTLTWENIPHDVKSLSQLKFRGALYEKSTSEIIELLERKKIIWEGKFNLKQVRENAKHEKMLEFNNQYYTESELFLYALVSRLHVMVEK